MENFVRPCRSRAESDVTATSASSITSFGSSIAHSDRGLLFGEIPQTPTGQSQFSKTSTCNLVLSSSSAFLRFWLSENCRSTFLSHVEKETLPSLRLVCNNFAASAAPVCFSDVDITFRTSVFKPSRLLSLNRVGRHVKSLRFRAPHSADSFLPPIVDQQTGEQISFEYNPQVESTSSREPKYGSWELTDLLIQQYPPMFHAATNIPSFIKAFSAMPNIEHITIVSPDQNMSPKYRKSVADYTLVSLRIAIEKAPLKILTHLTLSAIHPAALQNLQPVLSSGSTPSSCRRWTQISNLSVEMDSAPLLHQRSSANMRVLQAYLRSFCTSLTHLSFKWTGMSKGPSPVSPTPETHIRSSLQYQASSSSLQSKSTKLRRAKSIRFFNLKFLTLQSASMDSHQVATFITDHRATLKEFIFEDVNLTQGSWEATLASLKPSQGSEHMHNRMRSVAASRAVSNVQPVSLALAADEMYVPCMLSPLDLPELEQELIITDTLEPQHPEPTQPTTWFARMLERNRRPKRKQERSLSEQLKRVMHGHILPWR